MVEQHFLGGKSSLIQELSGLLLLLFILGAWGGGGGGVRGAGVGGGRFGRVCYKQETCFGRQK